MAGAVVDMAVAQDMAGVVAEEGSSLACWVVWVELSWVIGHTTNSADTGRATIPQGWDKAQNQQVSGQDHQAKSHPPMLVSGQVLTMEATGAVRKIPVDGLAEIPVETGLGAILVVAIRAVGVVTGDEKTSTFHNLTLLKSRNSGRYLG
jgi:hypothetical protein